MVQTVSNSNNLDNKLIKHFNEFEKEALAGVMAVSKDILESLKFALIFASKVTPEMQKETLEDLKNYRKKEKVSGKDRNERYREYVKDY